MMRAVAVREFGARPRLIEIARPEPGPGEVLVRLVAAGMNPFDWTIALGLVRGRAPHVFPLVLGVDGAGVVERTGPGVKRFSVGDQVYGAFLHPPYGRGSYAQYATLPEDAWIAPAPRTVPLAHSAGAPSAGMSALALLEIAPVHAGQSALIVGASGGVGSFLVQLARARGAHVIATARASSAQRLRGLGAETCVDYTRAALPRLVADVIPERVDVLFDLVSDADAFAANVGLVKDGGRAVSTRYAATSRAQATRHVAAENLDLTGRHASQTLLKALTNSIDTHGLRVDVQADIPLDRVPAELADGYRSYAPGKTIVSIS